MAQPAMLLRAVVFHAYVITTAVMVGGSTGLLILLFGVVVAILV